MKKIIILWCMIAFSIHSKAQTIIPIEKQIDYISLGKGMPPNSYFKDINNLLTKFIGTWKGDADGKKYTFIISKNTETSYTIKEDKLFVNYLITSSDGKVIEDTRTTPITGKFLIEGGYFSKDLSYYVSNYFGNTEKCWKHGTVYTRIKKEDNKKMSLIFYADTGMFWSGKNCPASTAPQHLLPLKLLNLTKQ